MRDYRLGLIGIGIVVLLSALPAFGQKIILHAGDIDRPAGPVAYAPKMPIGSRNLFGLKDPDGNLALTQLDTDGRLWWWADAISAGESREYTIDRVTFYNLNLTATPVDAESVEVVAHKKPFTTFHYAEDEPKVYLHPVIGPTGDSVTRDHPMIDNPLEKQNKRQDHRHHRSLWCAHGEIRTPDLPDRVFNFWHEREDGKTDNQRLRRIVRLRGGPVFAQIVAEIDWMGFDGPRLFTETRTYNFFEEDSVRIIDVTSRFDFNDRDITFSDTKEGGILSLRLAVTMDEVGIKDPKQVSGQMTNIHGHVGEKEAWGKEAAWCDYVGPVGDPTEEMHTVGVAVFDHPSNFRHPTRWHIRGYGLYTANPFGWSHFIGKGHDGSVTFKKGESVEFEYRVLIHEGDTEAAKVARRYQAYANPPEITLELDQKQADQ